jgi:16S rRNA (cytidine1402-2'-O)-methyltransferase
VLYICPTPIGNLGDVTLRVLDVLRRVDLIACEDTRHSAVLLSRYGIETRTVSHHEHNESERAQMLLPLLREGKDVAVVSDAGMPGLSDPGFTLVRACVAEGLPVTVLPGPSAVSTALVLSGLPAPRFAFVGFLARGRKRVLEQIAVFEGTGAAVVAFESPRRVRTTLQVIGSRWPDRRLAVCRELTKVHEEVVRGTAAEVLAGLADPVRGEVVLVLEPAGEGAAGGAGAPLPGVEERAREALAALSRLGVGTKDAAGVVATLTGLTGRRAYALALEVRADERSG